MNLIGELVVGQGGLAEALNTSYSYFLIDPLIAVISFCLSPVFLLMIPMTDLSMVGCFVSLLILYPLALYEYVVRLLFLTW